jgi:pSer/pThr/pTyr-binding forkhead associated (FHA) protein
VLVNGEHELPLPTDKGEIIIGREDPVSHIFPEVDLTPFGGESGGVSRQHARIQHTNDQWTISDLNSTNFTHVDGKRIEPNVAVPLYDGVQIRFGRISMVFKL